MKVFLKLFYTGGERKMVKPLVAIVGRPNVGKSTFFNKMAGKRISIVEDVPGVTRDRVYADAEWCGYSFTMIDTGGIEIHSEDVMWKHIRKQAELAVELADVILYFVDGKTGILPDDYDVADYLRASKKPIVLAVNKIDNSSSYGFYDFYALGLGEPIPVSAENSLNLGDLLDAVVAYFPEKTGIALRNHKLKLIPEIEHIPQQVDGVCLMLDAVQKIHQPAFLSPSMRNGPRPQMSVRKEIHILHKLPLFTITRIPIPTWLPPSSCLCPIPAQRPD